MNQYMHVIWRISLHFNNGVLISFHSAHGKDNAKTAQKLHAVLYTFLLRDELAKAVDFVDSLIFQASVDIPTSTTELPAFEDGSRPPLMTLVTHRSQVGIYLVLDINYIDR